MVLNQDIQFRILKTLPDTNYKTGDTIVGHYKHIHPLLKEIEVLIHTKKGFKNLTQRKILELIKNDYLERIYDIRSQNTRD